MTGRASETREEDVLGEASRSVSRRWDLSSVPLEHYVHLAAAWRRSSDTWQQVTRALEIRPPHPLVETIAVSGSLGRMEYQSRSDVDLVIVLGDAACADDQLAQVAFESVWESLASLELRHPRRHGVFATPTTRSVLCDPARFGKVEEDLPTFGKRIQLLLDCQPIFRHHGFHSLVGDVIAWYQRGVVEQGSCRCWDYLIHDVTRYVHAMAIFCEGRERSEPGTWRLRNLKRLYSRRMMVAGLLLLLGECGLSATDSPMFRSLLSLTPLERVGHVFAKHGEHAAFGRIAASYDTFLGRMDSETFHAALASPVESPEQLERNIEYATLRENAQPIARELIDFLIARRGQWSDRFFESLLF